MINLPTPQGKAGKGQFMADTQNIEPHVEPTTEPGFTPITSQDALDKIISKRLTRERDAADKKYGELEEKAAGYEQQIASLTAAAEESAKKYSGYDQTIADYDKQVAELQSKIKGYETDSAKTRIALECGIPYELSGRLTGETEEEIRKDAQSLASLIKAQQPVAPPKSTEPPVGDSRQAAYRQLISGLIGA